MSEIPTETEKKTASRGIRVALILVLLMTFGILGLFIAFTHLKAGGAGDSGATNDLVTPTPVASNIQGSLNVGRSVNYTGATITVTKVVQATSFSDDKKVKGPYVVRVYMESRVPGQTAVGIDYPSVTRLLQPGGAAIAPTLVTITPMTLPGETETGYFDFATSSKLDLSSLSLRLGENSILPFGK